MLGLIGVYCKDASDLRSHLSVFQLKHILKSNIWLKSFRICPPWPYLAFLLVMLTTQLHTLQVMCALWMPEWSACLHWHSTWNCDRKSLFHGSKRGLTNYEAAAQISCSPHIYLTWRARWFVTRRHCRLFGKDRALLRNTCQVIGWTMCLSNSCRNQL